MARKSSSKAKPAPTPEDEAAKAQKKRVKRLAKLEARLADAHAVRAQLDAIVRVLEDSIATLRGTPAAPAAPAAAPAAKPVRRPRPRRPAPPSAT
jgi:hypothetical protein